MRKLLLNLSLLFVGAASFAQADTTEFRMLGMSSGAGNLVYHNSDSSELTTLSHGFGSGHAVFINPADEMAYMIVDDPASQGNRNLYQIDPMSGTSTLVHDFTQEYIHTADLGEGGILYCIVGNGAVNAAELITLDLNTMTETATGFITAANGSRAMEYHPGDSTLYIYGGDTDMLWIVDLATMTETTQTTTGMNDELHGCFYEEEADIFHLSAYGGEMYTTDNTYLNGTQYSMTATYMDLSLIKLIRGEATTGYCPGDSAMLSLIYSDTDFKWFKDGVELTETNDTIYVSTPGVYRAAVAIATTGQYMWSREIVVDPYTVPNVNISQATNDTELCAGESIVLNGANGGSLQWYMNGSPIPGETGNTYTATAPGAYNQMKTNMSGCSDSSAVSYIITGCLDINELNNDVTLYPVPTDNYLNVDATSTIRSVFVTELTGRRVIAINNVNGNNVIVNTTPLSKGTYIVEVHTEAGVIQKTILK